MATVGRQARDASVRVNIFCDLITNFVKENFSVRELMSFRSRDSSYA